MLKASRYVSFRKGEGWTRLRDSEEEKRDKSRAKEDLEIGYKEIVWSGEKDKGLQETKR